MSPTLQKAPLPEGAVSTRDILRLLARRKRLFFSLWICVFLGALWLKALHFQGFHLQQDIYLKPHFQEIDYQHVLTLRNYLSSDPFLLREVLRQSRLPSIRLEDLQKSLTVKVLSTGSTINAWGEPVRGYCLGLYVRARSEAAGKMLLRTWTDLAVAEIQRMNREFLKTIWKLHGEIKKTHLKQHTASLPSLTHMCLARRRSANEFGLSRRR